MASCTIIDYGGKVTAQRHRDVEVLREETSGETNVEGVLLPGSLHTGCLKMT